MLALFINKPCHAPLFDGQSLIKNPYRVAHPSAVPFALLTEEADVPEPHDTHAELHAYLKTLRPPAPTDPPQQLPTVGPSLHPTPLAQRLRCTNRLWHTHCNTAQPATRVAIVTVINLDMESLHHTFLPWLEYHIVAGVCTVYVRTVLAVFMRHPRHRCCTMAHMQRPWQPCSGCVQ